MTSPVWIGLSGYSYKPWQGEGRFYPPELKQTQFLDYYRDRYHAVEMDGTWYRMPGEKAVEDWDAKTSEDFRFTFKLHRKITHMSRLKLDSLDALRFMLKRLGPLAAAGKLGPLLVQLPPNFRRNDERLHEFVANLPQEIEGVASLPRPLRFAIEFRHDSWETAEVESILRAGNVAWVAADTDEAPAQRRDTADFHYARLRKSAYDAQALRDWAAYFRATSKECFVYCKHEDDGAPWIWADQLIANLSQDA